MTNTTNKSAAAHNLVGKKLSDGWLVVEKKTKKILIRVLSSQFVILLNVAAINASSKHLTFLDSQMMVMI